MIDLYKRSGVKVNGKNPGTFIVKTGTPMVYGVTIPQNSPNQSAALEFINFLFEKDRDMVIIEKNGQPSVVPSSTNTNNKLPEVLKKYATQ